MGVNSPLTVCENNFSQLAVVIVMHFTRSTGDQEVAISAQSEILRKEQLYLQKEFYNTIRVVQRSFIERNVDVHDIVSSLQYILYHEEKEMVKNHFKEISEATSLDMLFFTFSNFWDYMHPGLLESIVQEFGTDNDKELVKKYEIDLEEYCGKVKKLGDFAEIERPNPSFANSKYSETPGK